MAYSNVTALANMDAVLGSLTTFLNSLTGWSLHTNLGTPTVGPTAGGRVTIASNGTTMVGLRSTTALTIGNTLALFSGLGAYSSGIEGSLNGDDGMGASYIGSTLIGGGPPNFRGFQNLTGPFPNLYMFSNAAGDYCHVVLEWSAGKFRHMAFGKVIQFGTWPGGNGSYFAGSFWSQAGLGSSTSATINTPSSNAHALPFDNNPSASGALLDWTCNFSNGTDLWIGQNESVFGSVQHRQGRASVRGGANRLYKNIQESLYTGLIPLAPIVLGAVKLSDTPTTVRFVGQVPDMRMVNMDHLTAAQELPIGSDTWKVFPFSSKGTTFGQESSAFAGLAYKKI